MKKVLLALLLAVATPLIHASNSPSAPDRDFPPFADLVSRRLDLTPAQRDQVKAILRRHQPAVAPLVDELRREHQSWIEQSRATDAKPEAVSAQADRVLAVQKRLMLEVAAARVELRAVLTPAQLAQLDELRDEGDKLFGKLRERFQSWLIQS